VIVDNASTSGVSIAGTWSLATAPSGFWALNYWHDSNTGKNSKAVRFTPMLPVSGSYEVFARWPGGAAPNGGSWSSTTPFDIYRPGVAGGYTTVLRDQSTQGGTWVSLGIYSFAAGTNSTSSVRVRNTDTGGYVAADAVRFVLQSGAPPQPTATPQPTGTPPPTATPTATPPPTGEIVLDNSSTSGISVAGGWKMATVPGGYVGSNYLHDDNTGKNSKAVRFTPTLPTSGRYEVFAWWPGGSAPNGGTWSSNTPFDVFYPGAAGGFVTVLRDQGSQGGTWVSLGTYLLNAGTSSNSSVRVRNDSTGGFVVADALKWVKVP
jgi:hypothetical protein